MDKNNQESEEIVISKSMSIIPIMAFLVVLLTSLSFIGAFMLQRKKTAIVMLLMQIVLMAFYYTGDITEKEIGEAYIFVMFLILSWLGVWLWGLILTSKVALTNNVLNVKDMDKNNQGSEDVAVSESMSVMAFWVVLLTSLSFIGAFMIQRKKTAIVMLLIQIAIVALFYNTGGGFEGTGEGYFLILFLVPLSLCVWLWGLILTARVALVHNELSVTAKEIIRTAVSLATLFVLLCLWFAILSGFGWLL